jgi:Fe-S oxidoreductase
MHSTRGRAHLLFEMLRGETITDGWRSKAVREALDLCLQCKGCKHDCPVSVDMATYKAEFLSHYYEGRLRPREAYAMGLIFLWSRLAMWAPGLVNGALRTPGLGTVIKWLAGFTPHREAPAYAAETFQDWWRKRPSAPPHYAPRPAVVLWPDTFSNFFLPGTLKAAVRVLEDAGYQIIVPQAPLCCGRPLYDYGMLDLARAKLERIIDELRPAIRAGIPLVGMEPSCLSVFRDEMPNLLAGNPDAERLAKQSKTLSELLLATSGWSPPRLSGRAVVHTHCHHKAMAHADAEIKMFEAMGLEVERPAAGCCGHAGSFGYEIDHYPLSMQIAEHELLPNIRKAQRDTIVVADGFSCRQQIKDGAGRWAMHPAEVVAFALESSGAVPAAAPERRYLEPPAKPRVETLVAAACLGVTVGIVLWRAARAGGHRVESRR